MKAAIAMLPFAAVLLLSVGATFAADFTFEVPVELRHVHPDFMEGNVSCDVYDESRRRISPVAGTRGFPIAREAYRGIVTVEISTVDAWRARRYKCELGLVQRASILLEGAVISRYGTDATVPSVWRVEGEIPAPTAGR